MDNALDRLFIGSVIVGEANGRYYEPAAERNGIIGINGEFRF